MNDFPENNFLFSTEEDEKKNENNSVNNNKNPHVVEAKKAQKHTLMDSLKELPGKADNISKKYRIWARQRKDLWFYKKYLDRVNGGLYERYGGEAKVNENIMKEDPVVVLKDLAPQYLQSVVKDINTVYQQILDLTKKLEQVTNADQAVSIVKPYANDFVNQDKNGKEFSKNKDTWHNRILFSTKYKISKALLRNGEHKVYGYTPKNMVLKGYPTPNHLIVSLFVANPEERPVEQSVTDIFKSIEDFDIIANSDKNDVFKIAAMNTAVLSKTVDNKIMEDIKFAKNNALNLFKNAQMENKKDQGKIIDSIWDGIKESSKELLSRKKYLIDCINVYFDMVMRIDKLAKMAIDSMLNVENEYRDKKYDRHAQIGHSGMKDKVHKIQEQGITHTVAQSLKGDDEKQQQRKQLYKDQRRVNRMLNGKNPNSVWDLFG